jgi:hypothetical protein
MKNKKLSLMIVMVFACIILVSGYTADNYENIQSTLKNNYVADDYTSIISVFGSDEITEVCLGNEGCIIQCSDNWNITNTINMNNYNVLINGTGNLYNLRNINNATRIRIQEGCIARW